MFVSKRTVWLALVMLTISLLASPAGPAGSLRPASVAASGAHTAQPGSGKSSLDLIEEDYGNGLLDRDNTNRYRQYAVSAPEKLPAKYRSSSISKDATYSFVQMAREWDQLSAAAKSEILDLRAKGLGELKESRVTEHFVLHYTRQGNSAVPAQDANGNSTPDFIDTAATSLETVWNRLVEELGYPAPKGTPEQLFHIYFRNIPYYGYAQPANVELTSTAPVNSGTASAWIVVENDFYGFPPNDEDRTGQEAIRSGALKVTLAHEFMHAIQFNINVYQSGWLMESHATWTEDIVYNDVNDWHWYINSFLRTPDYPLFNRYVYGAAFFQHYLSETRGIDVHRQIWEAARTNTTQDAVRIAAFGGSWEDIKAFAPAEYSLGISDFSRDAVSVIPTPRAFVSATHNAYPVSVDVPQSTKRAPNRAPWGLGANFVDFSSDATTGSITIRFDGADGYAWRAYAVATPSNAGGRANTVAIPLDSGSAGSVTISGFGTRWAKVTLVPTIADQAGAEVPYSYGASVE